jgi:hypothetical protein
LTGSPREGGRSAHDIHTSVHHRWVFDDDRNGPDETFIAFLAEMARPIVRSSEVERFNERLRRDGWGRAEVDGEVTDLAAQTTRSAASRTAINSSIVSTHATRGAPERA